MADSPSSDRRHVWRARREHLVVGSIGIEYLCASVFASWGTVLLWLPPFPTENPVITFVTARWWVELLLLVVGVAHLTALLAWPHTEAWTIAIRKAGSCVALVFWLALFVANVGLIPTHPSSIFAPLATAPIVAFLMVALARQRYRDW